MAVQTSIPVMNILLTFVLSVVVLVVFVAISTRGKHRTPPGPRPLPLVGNLFDVPQKHHWVTYANWGRAYGKILNYCFVGCAHGKRAGSELVQFWVFGSPVMVVNSAKAASVLFDKRSSIYSDRYVTNEPQFVYTNAVDQTGIYYAE